MQAEAPNTFRAVHTMIAFRATAAEFHHRLHVYQDQGFFHEKLVDEVEYAMETRERELEQYVFLDSAQMMLGLITCNKFNADHPIVGTFEQDKGDEQGKPCDQQERGDRGRGGSRLGAPK